ncbi:MAG: TadE/TadG family type IV pilus assembly protein [Geminicoccaceae bacterium]
MVEFALAAFPFLLILGGIIELTVLMLASSALQDALEAAGHDLAAGVTASSETAFRDDLCGRLPPFFGCGGDLKISVEDIVSFRSFDSAAAVSNSFSSAPFEGTVLIRATYSWATLFPTAALGIDVYERGSGVLYAATAIPK